MGYHLAVARGLALVLLKALHFRGLCLQMSGVTCRSSRCWSTSSFSGTWMNNPSLGATIMVTGAGTGLLKCQNVRWQNGRFRLKTGCQFFFFECRDGPRISSKGLRQLVYCPILLIWICRGPFISPQHLWSGYIWTIPRWEHASYFLH